MVVVVVVVVVVMMVVVGETLTRSQVEYVTKS